ncbi:hypothetical protein AB0E27_00565 [Streptomyces sparsogenes]|uniref:hypothetical protein n=1 Tax=Streptomyces sparsogenes TaxID=67365 RepID=UPI0033D78DDC
MLVIYTPAEGEPERYSVDDLSAMESEAIERVTGMEWHEVDQALKKQAPGVMRAVVWVWRKRQQPTLRFSDFDVPGWRKRLKARLEYDDVVTLLPQVRKAAESDEEFADLLEEMRKACDDPADLDRALKEDGPKEESAAPGGAAESGASLNDA